MQSLRDLRGECQHISAKQPINFAEECIDRGRFREFPGLPSQLLLGRAPLRVLQLGAGFY